MTFDEEKDDDNENPLPEDSLHNSDEVNEIAAYYEGKQPTVEETADGAENEADTPEVNASEEENDSAEQKTEAAVSDENSIRRLCIFAAIAAVITIASGFLIGRFVLPVSSDSITGKAAEMLKTDKNYLAAVADGKTINAEINALIEDGVRIENTFNDVIEYEKQLDELQSDFQELSDELLDARSALETARADYDSVQSSLTQIRSRTVTLSPGTYTVGIHIPSGKYSATGNGSLLTAGMNKNLKINTNLTQEPYVCELAENDTIKLSTEAKFVPEV